MPSPPGAGLYSRVVPSRPCPVLKGDLVRSPSFLYALFSILAGCQPAAADRDSSPAAPAPTTAKTLERAAPEAVTPEVSVHNIVYVCENGRRLAARYDGERAFLSLGERTLTLVLHPAASGARYIGEGMQWWTRGMDQAQLATLPSGATYQDAEAGVFCRSVRPSISAID